MAKRTGRVIGAGNVIECTVDISSSFLLPYELFHDYANKKDKYGSIGGIIDNVAEIVKAGSMYWSERRSIFKRYSACE
jgi:hypothetical protein